VHDVGSKLTAVSVIPAGAENLAQATLVSAGMGMAAAAIDFVTKAVSTAECSADVPLLNAHQMYPHICALICAGTISSLAGNTMLTLRSMEMDMNAVQQLVVYYPQCLHMPPDEVKDLVKLLGRYQSTHGC
jgi:hypothetical protein